MVMLTTQSTDQRANLVPAPDGYTLLNMISETPSAQVWLSRNTNGEEVVLKRPSEEFLLQERFVRELQSMLASANTNVMPILDHDNTYSWYAMPLALRSLYEVNLPYSVDECIEVIQAVSAGLNRLHSDHQVHRDLKPQNILWLDDRNGARWVVADFGIVRNPLGQTTNQLTRAGNFMGSDGWAAPEQYRDAHEVSIRTDVYSLGAVASWLLTGRLPVPGAVTMPSDARLAAVIRKATRPLESDRYAHLDDFVEAFIRATQPFVGEFEALVQQGEWAEVSTYFIGSPSDWGHVLSVLQRDQQSVDSWAAVDGAGMVDAVSAVLVDVSQMTYTDMDSFLSWCVGVVRALANAGKLDLAEKLAEDLFGATESVDQYIPARNIVNWLAVLTPPISDAMERALHASRSWDYFQTKARDRYENYADTDLIKKLRRS